MARKSSLVTELTGVITSLGHIFWLKKQQLFIFNVSSETGTFSVVVRRVSQLVWQETLSIGTVYTCYNLKRSKLYQGTNDEVDVLVATSQTKITAQASSVIRQFVKDVESSNFISYQGTVTTADASLQLYQLDGSCQLVVSALAAISSCPQLLLGDRVVVHDAHWLPDERCLYACGRTLVRVLDRRPEPVVSCRRSAVHTLHRFTLPPTAVWWYRHTASLLSAAGAADERTLTEDREGALYRLLLSERLPSADRSLTKDFVCRPHRCAATEQFCAPFDLTPLSELVSAAITDSVSLEPSGGGDGSACWQHWVHGGDSRRRVVAQLIRDGGGGLLLSTDAGGCTAPLLVVPPSPSGRSPPADGLVVVIRPRLVVEQFGRQPPLVYLLCGEEQLVPLEDGPPAADQRPPPSVTAASPTRLLLYQRGAPRRPPADGDAGAGCVYRVLHGLLEEAGRRRPVLIRLTGAAASRASHLTRGASYLLHSDDPHWSGREQAAGQLKLIRSWLPDCTVLRAPEDLQFTADLSPSAPSLPPCDVFSVSQLTPGGPDDGLLTVRGVIIERHHTRDRFARNTARESTISLEAYRVVLVLCDPVTRDEVYLYVCEPSQWCSLLGLIPGAALTVHAVRWGGGDPGTHLVTTRLSELQLTDWGAPSVHTGIQRPRLHLPVRFLSVALSDHSVTRWLSCVTVADLHRVSVAAECSLCGHQWSAGCCGFVGCHGRGRPVFNARARSVLDDGSAAVTAQLIGDSVRQLLAATDDQWRALTTEAEQRGEIYFLLPRSKSGRAPAPVDGPLASLCLSGTIRRPIVCELKKFTNPPATSTASDAAQTVFCESVMEASADVVARLFPDPASRHAGSLDTIS